MRFFPSKNVSVRKRLSESAATSSRWRRLSTHCVRSGSSHVTVGPATPRSLTLATVVFGRMLPPGVETFFASWKSAARIWALVRPIGIRGASAGRPKIAYPVTGSYAEAPTRARRYESTSEVGSIPESRPLPG